MPVARRELMSVARNARIEPEREIMLIQSTCIVTVRLPATIVDSAPDEQVARAVHRALERDPNVNAEHEASGDTCTNHATAVLC